VVAVYAMLRSFPNCDFRFKQQGRAIFTVTGGVKKVDVAYVGLNRTTGENGQYGLEVYVRWRDIVNNWPETTTLPFRDVLMQLVPKKKNGILSTSQREGVYVQINMAKDLPEEKFQMFLTGFKDFMIQVTSVKG
jgi:hypothetical protein